MRFAWRVIAAVTLMMGAALVLLMNFDSVSAQMPGFSKNQELPLPDLAPVGGPRGLIAFVVRGLEPSVRTDRSEERRVGKEGRSCRGWGCRKKEGYRRRS